VLTRGWSGNVGTLLDVSCNTFSPKCDETESPVLVGHHMVTIVLPLRQACASSSVHAPNELGKVRAAWWHVALAVVHSLKIEN
jgi:hypothetical protein